SMSRWNTHVPSPHRGPEYGEMTNASPSREMLMLDPSHPAATKCQLVSVRANVEAEAPIVLPSVIARNSSFLPLASACLNNNHDAGRRRNFAAMPAHSLYLKRSALTYA